MMTNHISVAQFCSAVRRKGAFALCLALRLVGQSLSGTRTVLLYLAAVSLVALLGLAAPAGASTVGCAGAPPGGPFDFPSLSAALSAGPLTNLTITVSGVCTEFVVVDGAQNLRIIGTPGATLMDRGDPDPGLAGFGAVLEIDNSQNVLLQGLVIQLVSRPINVQIPGMLVSSSLVRVQQCRLEGAGASDGIDMYLSTVRLIGATVIENNNDGQGSGEGVYLQGPNAGLFLQRNASGCPLIQGSGDNGIWASGGGANVQSGCATIQNNGFAGIYGELGATIQLSVAQASPGAIQIQNNAVGVVVVVGSRFGLNGPINIQGNTWEGVRLRSASGSIGGTLGPMIQQNGTNPNPPCCAPTAGISVANNSSLDLGGAQVTGNSAPGVLVQDDSSVRVIGPLTITGNPIGVEVVNASSAAFFLTPTITGNSTADVVCGPDSIAYGDLSAVGKTVCPQFKPQQNAVAPPKHGKVTP